MSRFTVVLFIFAWLISANSSVYANSVNVNETESELSEALGFALIRSLTKPINQAIKEIYKNDKNAPEYLSWDAFSTEILKIKQLYGIGGAYEITLKVKPYYRAHNTYGEDRIVVSADGELIRYEHLKTYPKEEYNR
ncbi:hypothetical protein HNQ94_001240 [Salirhabdus euzebyi]|uniref:DUF3888 domain-containing protein n=1 Tax=Salirhabdus euzebyi TaxID=394506 RepID=A0A841PXL3_9BACI|nr:DUF3888 domain-containing protein [Salirhabdus euzebyi]MBB6452794.1 hypothetical protein [Salirhabdus euzebyi]